MPRDFLGVVEVNEMEIEILGIFGNEIGRLRRGKATDSRKAAFVLQVNCKALCSCIDLPWYLFNISLIFV